jgi:hypothetical protein
MKYVNVVVEFLKEKTGKITAEMLGWLAIVVLHASTLPTYFAIMSGLTDKLPSVDIVLMIIGGLALLFAKAVIQRDILNIVTIGLGFIAQSALMVLIFFK